MLVSPGQASASFWINGTKVATGYTGDPDYDVFNGTGFGALSGGGADINSLNLSTGLNPVSVPPTIGVSAVREPSTWGMMALGFAGLGYAGYRGRRSALAAAL